MVATISRATAACTLCQKGAMYRGWCQRCGGRDGGGKRQSTETGHALPCLGSASPLRCVARCDPDDPPDANCVVATVVSCTGPSHMRSPFACHCTELNKKHPVLARNKRPCRQPRRGAPHGTRDGSPLVAPVSNQTKTIISQCHTVVHAVGALQHSAKNDVVQVYARPPKPQILVGRQNKLDTVTSHHAEATQQYC